MQGKQCPSWGVGGCRAGGEQVQSFQAPCGNPGEKSIPAFLLACLSPAPQRLRPHPAPYPAPRPRAHSTRRSPLTWGAGPLGPSPRTGTTSLLRSDPVCQGDGTSRAAFPEPSTRAPALRRRPALWGWGRPPEGHGKVLQGAAARAPCWLARSRSSLSWPCWLLHGRGKLLGWPGRSASVVTGPGRDARAAVNPFLLASKVAWGADLPGSSHPGNPAHSAGC